MIQKMSKGPHAVHGEPRRKPCLPHGETGRLAIAGADPRAIHLWFRAPLRRNRYTYRGPLL